MAWFDVERHREDDGEVRRLQAILDRLPALVGYWDLEQRNVLANAAYVGYFGLEPEQVRGMALRDVLGEELYESNLPFVTAVLQGREQQFARTLVGASGQVLHAEVCYVPDVVDGVTQGFFVLVTDVSERMEAQQTMQEAQRLARLGSWSMDVSTARVRWSAELCRIFGVDPTFVPSFEDLLTRIDPRDVDSMHATIRQAHETGQPYEQTFRIVRADGEVREVHCLGSPLCGVDGTVVRLSGTLQDVTERNAATRELARVDAELRQVNARNADVLAMLGHDVRSPLTVILGYLEELTTEADGTDDAPVRHRDQLGRVLRAAQRLQGLVDDILAMATVDHGQISTRPVRTSLVGQVREVLSTIPGGEAVTLCADGDPHAWADGFHVRQVVANLVTNALRHGRAPVSVSIAERDDATVTLTVADHGPGVPEHEVSSLFQRFRAGASHRSQDGAALSSGFGLYVAAGLASANGGRVDYAGSSAGAAFVLTLPTPRPATRATDRAGGG